MKSIDTLVDDIKGLLDEGVDSVNEESLKNMGEAIASSVKLALLKSERKPRGTLRTSNIGKPCNRQLYYEVNSPEEKEPLPPQARMKFLFGHILEEVMLFLCEEAGHSVEGRQDEIDIVGIKGHRDAVIDGVVVDVKSASTYSFKKFEEHNLEQDDPFGYMDQIQSYLHAGQEDDLVTDKERCAFLVVDKTLGNICLDVYPRRPFPIEKLYEYKKDMVAREDPPRRGFDPVPDGKSGNMKLPMACSYCDFKNLCHPNLRTFLYARGPVFLTTVKKEPDVSEVLRDGSISTREKG